MNYQILRGRREAISSLRSGALSAVLKALYGWYSRPEHGSTPGCIR